MQILIATLLTGAVGLAAPHASPIGTMTMPTPQVSQDALNAGSATIWQVKNDKPGKGPKKAKGNGNGNAGKAKPAKAEKNKQKAGGKPASEVKDAKLPPGQARKAEKAEKTARKAFDDDTRRKATERMARVPVPNGRDMAAILGLGGLILLDDGVTAASLTDDAALTYRNCPPGLAKKDPPCVPPGLAKKGVTFDEWSGYDSDRLDRIWLDRREVWLDRDVDIDDRYLLLTSDQVAGLFGLDPAPRGQRYALIDGMPVLLDDEDYASLLLVNELAQTVGLDSGIDIAPTAALSQADLIRLYRLPSLADGQNYAVLNGQIVRLTDSEYETLQLIRIARAVL